MDRRSFIAAATGCVVGGLAGCSAPTDGSASRDTPTGTPLPLARQGRPQDICSADVVDAGIYAIDDPAFAADWSAVSDDALADETVVIGIERAGEARAYPLPVLTRHEIVNDVVPGTDEPIIVTFCPLCRSGMVASALVDGTPTTFSVSGQLWLPPELQSRAREADDRVFAVEWNDPDPGVVRNTANLVMVDELTGSYWSQLLVQAICGPQRGETLSVVPSTTARWSDWHDEHPDTDVLLPPPHSGVQDFSEVQR